MNQALSINQVQQYQQPPGRKRMIFMSLVKKVSRIALSAISIGMVLFGVIGLILITPKLTRLAAAAGYTLHLHLTPLSAVKFLSDDDAEWLGEIRERGCPLKYYAEQRVAIIFTGHPELQFDDEYAHFARCFDSKLKLRSNFL